MVTTDSSREEHETDQQQTQHPQQGCLHDGHKHNISVDDDANATHILHHKKQNKELIDTSTMSTGGSTNNASNIGSTNSANFSLPGNAATCFPSRHNIPWSRRKKPKSECNEKGSGQDETPTRGELLLAQELQKLSMEEREKVQNDIHAVAQEVPETTELVDESLQQLEERLKALRNKKAYEKALFFRPKFVQDHQFQLQFLRDDLWDVTAAAKRIIRHFESKLKLFGINKLAKRITWDDLDPIDQHNVQTGALQFFTNDCCDRKGRPIFFTLYNLRRNFYHNRQQQCIHHQQQQQQQRPQHQTSEVLSFLPAQSQTAAVHQRELESHVLLSVKRVYWYTIMSGIQQSVEAQRKGGVIVAYIMGTTAAEFYDAVKMDTTDMIIGSIPIRTVGAHMCLTDRILLPLFSALMAAGPKQMRLRTRIHFGSHLEVQYALNTFGLDNCAYPVDGNGNLKMELFQRRLGALLEQEKIYQEQHETKQGKHGKSKKLAFPLETDILLGRGMPYQKHPGTMYLQHCIECNKARHDALSRTTKYLIVQEIVQALKTSGVRFLKRDGDYWVEVAESVATEKVAMGFRNLSRREKRINPYA